MNEIMSRSDILAWNWSDAGFDPWQEPYRAEQRLNQAWWLTNGRRSNAPTPAEARNMICEQIVQTETTIAETAMRAGIDKETTRRTLNGTAVPGYASLARLCNAVGIEITVTPPGEAFAGTTRRPVQAAEPGERTPEAPTLEEIQEVAAARLEELKRMGITPKAIAAHREGVTEDGLKRLKRGLPPTYDKLRTMLAAIEIELVVKPVGAPLPEALRHARFTAAASIPVLQTAEHDSGIDVSGETITELPAPWDMTDEALKHACYVISPDERMVPSGMKAGEYCLAGRARRNEPDTPVYVELKDGSSMLGLRLNTRIREREPMSLLRWGKAEDNYDPALMDIPNNEITRELVVLAMYEGRPSTRRPPKRIPEAK